jgi:hypothetical protein
MAKDTPTMALAPSFDLFLVPSISLSRLLAYIKRNE